MSISNSVFFSTFYSRKLKICRPATPGTPKIADTSTVAALMPTAAPRLCPKKSRPLPTAAEPRSRRHTCSGPDRAISPNTNRQTKIEQVIT